jgi:hypothetical protein
LKSWLLRNRIDVAHFFGITLQLTSSYSFCIGRHITRINESNVLFLPSVIARLNSTNQTNPFAADDTSRRAHGPKQDLAIVGSLRRIVHEEAYDGRGEGVLLQHSEQRRSPVVADEARKDEGDAAHERGRDDARQDRERDPSGPRGGVDAVRLEHVRSRDRGFLLCKTKIDQICRDSMQEEREY